MLSDQLGFYSWGLAQGCRGPVEVSWFSKEFCEKKQGVGWRLNHQPTHRLVLLLLPWQLMCQEHGKEAGRIRSWERRRSLYNGICWATGEGNKHFRILPLNQARRQESTLNAVLVNVVLGQRTQNGGWGQRFNPVDREQETSLHKCETRTRCGTGSWETLPTHYFFKNRLLGLGRMTDSCVCGFWLWIWD